jgi:hypothetical protein
MSRTARHAQVNGVSKRGITECTPSIETNGAKSVFICFRDVAKNGNLSSLFLSLLSLLHNHELDSSVAPGKDSLFCVPGYSAPDKGGKKA